MGTAEEIRAQADAMIQSLHALLADANSRYIAAMGQLGLRDKKIADLEARLAGTTAPEGAGT